MTFDLRHNRAFVVLSTLISIFLPSFVHTAEINVPFTSQAPYANWSEPWHNACEETSITMVHGYYTNNLSFTKIEAKQHILEIFSIKNTFIGKSFDEPVEIVTQLINEFLPWEAHILENPTITDIKREIDANQPVIIPVLANTLQNPHFRGTFPYHMLVISGYDDNTKEFITQEPGTRYGKNYRYTYDTIDAAIRDFDPLDIENAPRRVIATNKTVEESENTDGDNDGLTKIQEIMYGTSLTNTDSDDDGYTDGEEVLHGYSPTINEKRIKNGTVVKVTGFSTVFLYSNGILSSFANEKSFLSRGYTWSQILPISPAYRDLQTRGSVLY